MSKESWIEEFYKNGVENITSEKEAVERSLKKWTGLLPENLEKHELLADRYLNIREPDDTLVMDVDGSNCGLCEYYDDACQGCSISRFTKTEGCMDEGSAWLSWAEARNGDPKPMVKLLTEILEETQWK